jgi:hypothetical protein
VVKEEEGLAQAEAWCTRVTGCDRAPGAPSETVTQSAPPSSADATDESRVWRDKTTWCKLPPRSCFAAVKKLSDGCHNITLAKAKDFWTACPARWARVDAQTRELTMDCPDGSGQYALIDPFANAGKSHYEPLPPSSPRWKKYNATAPTGAPQTGGPRVFLTPLGIFLPPHMGFHSEIWRPPTSFPLIPHLFDLPDPLTLRTPGGGRAEGAGVGPSRGADQGPVALSFEKKSNRIC